MKMGVKFLAALVVLTSASSFATAADPNPLQEFCVATNDTKDAVFVNGQLCKDPKLAGPDDFYASGIHTPSNTSNRLGSKVVMFDVETIPGLNTLGVSVARIDLAPDGVNPPHSHPRTSELLVVLEGTIYAGFITSTHEISRLFWKELNKGDVFAFPMGLIHFQHNSGNTSAVALACYGSQRGGVVKVPNTIFGASPPIEVDVLTKAFQLDEKVVKHLQELSWLNSPTPPS
ncbi:germin-like protein subfamily 1 member 17 [Malania oleifera]|uniref:germin-like protein subfamily 1 member 17 n=1 Tax=Malania oleifera TaxID=397392 RepID=UPI0025ADC90A|nr:germin-like protein subfamily 1 member 17 [Malania oleifera]